MTISVAARPDKTIQIDGIPAYAEMRVSRSSSGPGRLSGVTQVRILYEKLALGQLHQTSKEKNEHY